MAGSWSLTSKKWQLPKPSVFTPFLRRFTDERALDIAETRELYRSVDARHKATVWSGQNAIQHLTETILEGLAVDVPYDLRRNSYGLVKSLLELETTIFRSADDPDIGALSLKELVDLRRFLRAQEHFLDHEEETIDLLVAYIQGIVEGTIKELPKLDAPSPFTVPLINLISNPGNMVERIVGSISIDKLAELGMFAEVGAAVDDNINTAYKIDPKSPPKRKLPSIGEKAEEEGWGPREVTDKILKRTPFHDFLTTPLPLKFDLETRFSHTHIIGGSGAGKTQLLQNMILHDLESEDPPTLIIVDSQSDLINKLSRLEVFHPDYGEHAGKLTLISPRDIDHPPAINIFDVRRDRLSSYSPAMREQVTAGVIQTFDYLFTGLLGADLTAKQSVFFRFVARLMLALPETMGRNATILDMMNLMDDPGPYRDAIKSLPPIQRNFFERDFQGAGFKQTKEQIRYRLQAILENPTLERLFTSESTKIDFFDEMNKGGVILIDTAKDFLKGSSGHFGRIFISMVLQAALERASIPQNNRKPTFLIIDEAAEYFDGNIDDLLTQVRKYSVGCVFAHQFLDQCTQSLRASLAANTSTKLCASLSVSDARAMAPELRTTAEQILKQKKLHFSCFIRNVTPEVVSVPVEVGKLEDEPQLSDEDFARLIELNVEKVSLVAPPPDTVDEGSVPQQQPDEVQRAPESKPKPQMKPATQQRKSSSTPPPVPIKPKPTQDDPDDSATEW
jgi:hypothetical protein